jgi:hypothetical protein
LLANDSIIKSDENIAQYIKYGKLLNFFEECATADEGENSQCDAMFIKWAKEAYELILERNKIDYVSKFGPVISKINDEKALKNFKNKANNGDLEAIFELQRYYENPENKDYDPEHREARKWLLKGVEYGSKLAMEELGYDYPYIGETTLANGDDYVSVYAVCNGFNKNTKSSTNSNCHMYFLTFYKSELINKLKDNESNLRNDLNYDNFVIRYAILVNSLSEKMSYKPRKLAFVKVKNNIFVELVSELESYDGKKIRKDYFTIDGKYCGSNSEKYTQAYFYDFKSLSKTIPPQIFNKKFNLITIVNIKEYPDYESFQVREKIRSKFFHALDDIKYGNRQLTFSPTLGSDGKIKNAVDKYLFVFGYHPSLSRNHVFLNFKPYKDIKKCIIDKNCDFSKINIFEYIIVSRLLHEYFLNPLNVEYDPNYKSPYYYDQCANYYECDSSINSVVDPYKNNNLAPYIAQTKIWVNDRQIIILNICQGASSIPNPKLFIETNSCFAQQLEFTLNESKNYHFIIESQIIKKNIDSKQKWWSGISATKFGSQQTIDGKNILALDNYNQGKYWTSWRKDYFNLNGQYLGSYNSEISSLLLSDYKPFNHPIIPAYSWNNDELVIYLNTSPTFEDRQIQFLKRINK